MPRFPSLSDSPPRRGFFTRQEVDTLLDTLPAYLRDFVLFAFITGWRKSEIRRLLWDDIDLERGEIRIWESKNGEGRVISINRTIRHILERRGPREHGFVFTYQGRAVGDFKKAWATAVKHAHLDGRTFHDLRRSAVRNLVGAGVSRQVAKRITGHKTDSIFDRYHIVSDGDVKEAMRRLDQCIEH